MKHILRCHDIVKTDFVRGDNCYLYDSQGRRYVDFESGIWCTALGHNHPRIVQTIQMQAERLIHLGTRYPSDLAEVAASAVLDIVNISDGKCVFLSSGSEAVEFGSQIARRATGRSILLTLSDSYLAAYGSAGQKRPEEWNCFDWGCCAACSLRDTCDPDCSHLRDVPFESIGAFVFEPGSASGKVQFPPVQMIRTLVEATKKYGGLVVVNEVTTGMGRTGAWFGYQHYGLQPDIIAIGKGLGNGYPVSAVVMTQDVAHLLENGAFHYAQSHQNDPLGCAIAFEVIAVLREQELIERGQHLGRLFQAKLRGLEAQYEAVKEVRGRGLMIALEFCSGNGPNLAASAYRELLERGFLVGCYPAANLLRFDPALTVAEEDINQLLENLNHILGMPSTINR